MNSKLRIRRSDRSMFAGAVGLTLMAFGGVPSADATIRHVPGEFPDIQTAINASVSRDTVLLSPGTYRGHGNREITFAGKDIVLVSSDGPATTIIDCENAGRGFNLQGGETRAARIEGLTIEHGNALGEYVDGGAIFCLGSSPSIVNCRVLDNYASQDGGGLELAVFGGVVDRCFIAGNYSGSGGGLAWFYGQAQITNCVIAGNWAYDGGGLYLNGPVAYTFTGCTIAGNLGSDGGGIFCPNPLTLNQCILWGNCAFLDGSELETRSACTLTCCDVDTAGVESPMHPVAYRQCVFTDPQFCSVVRCGQIDDDNCTLSGASPCLPENSPCGRLIGALGEGCPAPPGTGACCLPDGTCRVGTFAECHQNQGAYQGDNTTCSPNPCIPVPTKVMTWGQIKSTFRGNP